MTLTSALASSETYFGEVTRVGKTDVRAYGVPLVVPSAKCTPVPRGIAKLVIVATTPVENGRGWPAWPPPKEQPGVLPQCHVAW